MGLQKKKAGPVDAYRLVVKALASYQVNSLPSVKVCTQSAMQLNLRIVAMSTILRLRQAHAEV